MDDKPEKEEEYIVLSYIKKSNFEETELSPYINYIFREDCTDDILSKKIKLEKGDIKNHIEDIKNLIKKNDKEFFITILKSKKEQLCKFVDDFNRHYDSRVGLIYRIESYPFGEDTDEDLQP